MTSLRHLASLTLVGVTILGIGACNRNRADRERSDLDRPANGERPVEQQPVDRPSTTEGPGTTTLTGAQVVNNQTAIDQIVAARCAREATCNEQKPGDKRTGDKEPCAQRIKADMKDDLNVNECPRGIDQKELNECLEAIKKEDCNNPIDAISRLAACRTSDLCLKHTTENR